MTDSASQSAIQKLERWFSTLSAEEKTVISDIVRSALVHSADPRVPSASRSAGAFAGAITPQSAPELVQSIAGKFGAAPPPVYKSWAVRRSTSIQAISSQGAAEPVAGSI